METTELKPEKWHHKLDGSKRDFGFSTPKRPTKRNKYRKIIKKANNKSKLRTLRQKSADAKLLINK